MKIEAGKFYRTRDGRKARVYAVDGGGEFPIHGAVLWPDDKTKWDWCQWKEAGDANLYGCTKPYDLISEWVDRPVVDWSKMAAWHRWVAMDSDKRWYAYPEEPALGSISWNSGLSNVQNLIHPNYSPTFSGNWRDSLVERPTA